VNMVNVDLISLHCGLYLIYYRTKHLTFGFVSENVDGKKEKLKKKQDDEEEEEEDSEEEGEEGSEEDGEDMDEDFED